MKLTIDTKEDSHEDIYKILQILTNILNKKELSEHNPGYNQSSNSVDTTGMMSMFDNSYGKKEIPNTPPDFPVLMKLTREAQETKRTGTIKPRVEIF